MLGILGAQTISYDVETFVKKELIKPARVDSACRTDSLFHPAIVWSTNSQYRRGPQYLVVIFRRLHVHFFAIRMLCDS
jgi:hypothetical protein